MKKDSAGSRVSSGRSPKNSVRLGDVDALVAHMIDKPFADFGRGPSAYDCYGAVIEWFGLHGKVFPDYGSVPSGDTEAISGKITEHIHIVRPIETPKKHALVDFKMRDHIAVMIDGRRFLHAVRGKCVMVTPIDHPVWGSLLSGFHWWTSMNDSC